MLSDEPRALKYRDRLLRVSVKGRVFRAVASITLALAAMALVAHAFAHLSRTDWVWWLAPLTVVLEGTRFIRTDLGNGAAFLSSSADAIDADPEASGYVVSCAIATGMAVWGAYAGNRLAILTGTAIAVVWNALEWGEQPVFESCSDRALCGDRGQLDQHTRPILRLLSLQKESHG